MCELNSYLDCYILYSEHGLTSFLFVSQLQLEVFHAPFVYRVSVNPTTFREEPRFFVASRSFPCIYYTMFQVKCPGYTVVSGLEVDTI